MIHRNGISINSNLPSGWERALPPGVRRVINRQKRGKKAISREPVVVTSLSKWLWSTTSEGMDEASSSRTCQHWLTGTAQRGKVSGHAVNLNVVSTRKKPGVKYRPTVTENGHSERGNPPVALSQESRRPGHKHWRSRMTQEAKAQRNGWDRLTWVR